ncbi:glycosyltransferase family 2 protein [Patescibacteria group bacterium]|nr:glycosyltransferase family 2 protein [Patescibacteria group bacterium]MBU1890899.1 glycosyltransferase family 2 protein [Patescibacteria group bacterium]
MKEFVDVTIIIVSWRVKGLLEECLRSVIQETKNISYEIFVVDNNSNDGTVEMINKQFPNVMLIANEENMGFAQANNQAMEKANGKFILLLNPDTKILDNAIEKTMRFMEENPDAGIAGCHFQYPNQKHQPSVRRFPTLLSMSLILLKLHRIFPSLPPLKKYIADDIDYSYSQMVDQVMGAFFMIDRKLFEQVGYLDSKYFIWFEEVDYCYRAIKAGWKIYYFSGAEIFHYHAQSFNQVLGYEKQKIYNKSLSLYFKKYHSMISYVVIRILSVPSLIISLIVQQFKR